MKITKHTKIAEMVEKYPFLMNDMQAINSKFSMLKNKVAMATMGKVATLTMVSNVGGMNIDDLIAAMQKIVDSHGAEPIDYRPEDEQERLDILKAIIKDMHKQQDNSEAKQKFNELLKNIDPDEIKTMEQQLVMEGMPVKEVQKLCDLHVGVFKDALAEQTEINVPSGHPIDNYMRENHQLELAIEEIEIILNTINPNSSQETIEELQDNLKANLEKIASVDKHYVRKENQLFPFMEKHGITAPPQVMWGVHDEIRSMIKEAKQALESSDPVRIKKSITTMNHAITEMIYKEEKIMYAMVLQHLTDDEWSLVRVGEDELGYILGVTPGDEWKPEVNKERVIADTKVPLDTGRMTVQQINGMLKNLPFDISFVDVNDEVAYYSDTKERIFPRTPAVIGRKVQNCHPPQSVHVVQEILDEFRTGRKDTAEFWITMHGKDLHIRYFAVKDDLGQYLGTLEVSQEITAIKKLEGERRLLDWTK